MNAVTNSPCASDNTWARALRDHRLGYPDVHVVRFLSSEQRREGRSSARRGLDVGFGSGQHLRTLSEYGYETWGTELLADAIPPVRAAVGRELRGGCLLQGGLDELPQLGGRFDVALAWGVACLYRPSRLVEWLRRLRDVLRPGGAACLNFRTPENWFRALGEELEPHCYALDERAGPYRGAIYSFLDEAEVRSAIREAGLTIENFERDDWWRNNLREHHSWWIVWARKDAA